MEGYELFETYEKFYINHLSASGVDTDNLANAKWQMLKGPMLNLSVLDISVFKERPYREQKICMKNVLKKVQNAFS